MWPVQSTHFEETEPRWDKEPSVHSEARLLAVRPRQRGAGVTGKGGRNQRGGEAGYLMEM